VKQIGQIAHACLCVGTLVAQYRLHQAKSLSILRLKETVLGKEHPRTLISMSNLTEVLSNQGMYEQAEKTHRRALRLYETVLGEGYPYTISANTLHQSMNEKSHTLNSLFVLYKEIIFILYEFACECL
jgi:hypothetical protein